MDPDFPLDEKYRAKADELQARRAEAQGKRAQPPKTWEEAPIESLQTTSGVRVWHRAWITEGNNDLGLRSEETQPIVIPSPSPGAWHK